MQQQQVKRQEVQRNDNARRKQKRDLSSGSDQYSSPLGFFISTTIWLLNVSTMNHREVSLNKTFGDWH